MPTLESSPPKIPPAASHNPQSPFSPKISSRWKWSRTGLLAVAGSATLFLLLSYVPLADPELWNALLYGEAILAQRQLPNRDLLSLFAEGMPLVDTQWLTEVLLAQVAAIDETWLSVLGAGVMITMLVTIGLAYRQRAGSTGVALLISVTMLAIGWPRYALFRPEQLGGLCWALLLWLITRLQATTSRRTFLLRWLALPLLFCVWANLHPSFLAGLAVLGCLAVGLFLDDWWSTGSAWQALRTSRFHQAVYALELALVASCLTPHGIDLFFHLGEVVRTLSTSNRVQLPEWQPLDMQQGAGPMFALSIVVLMILLRKSRARWSAGDLLLLALFATATLRHQRLIAWYAPVWGYVIAPHLGDLATRWQAATPTGKQQNRTSGSWYYTLLALLAVWIAFAWSDASRPLMGRSPRSPQQLYGLRAPLGLAAELQAKPPAGNVFQPLAWSDWLQRQAPHGWQPMVTSRVASLPPQVWQDYQHIATAQGGWRNVLQRYHLQTAIVDRRTQPALATGLRLDPEWEVVYQDAQAIVFHKR